MASEADILRANLVTLAQTYAKATGSTLSEVSRRSYGNSKFLGEFKDGVGSCSIDKFGILVGWFRDHWPSGQEWPYLRAAVIEPPKKTVEKSQR